MTKTNLLLTLSLACFAISLTGACWGIFLPAGAILFGLFMIFNALAKESALFDEEQRSRFALADTINQSQNAKLAGSGYNACAQTAAAPACAFSASKVR